MFNTLLVNFNDAHAEIHFIREHNLLLELFARHIKFDIDLRCLHPFKYGKHGAKVEWNLMLKHWWIL